MFSTFSRIQLAPHARRRAVPMMRCSVAAATPSQLRRSSAARSISPVAAASAPSRFADATRSAEQRQGVLGRPEVRGLRRAHQANASSSGWSGSSGAQAPRIDRADARFAVDQGQLASCAYVSAMNAPVVDGLLQPVQVLFSRLSRRTKPWSKERRPRRLPPASPRWGCRRCSVAAAQSHAGAERLAGAT